ncbi:MAG: pyruvate kinase [Ignisphaera sp.]|uniref:Pyruvate kinase n=1 Tax=Ignisphaera aggregans TaxID=334771 RepID=A0A7C4JJA6_9CREN
MYIKKIASIGPSSAKYEVIKAMAEIGIDGFRINFAHGSPEEWKQYVEYVRRTEAELNKPLTIMGDISGPSIRIGEVKEAIMVKKGDIIRFVLGVTSDGDSKSVPVPIKKFFEIVDIGDTIVMDDGKSRLQIIDRGSGYVEAVALTDSVIKSRKTLTISGKELDLPILSERDKTCIKFAVENDFDYIGLSYVRSSEDIEGVKEVLKRYGGCNLGIIAKIETRSALKNLNSIIDVSDVVLVARGDLGMNFGLEEIHNLQRYIVDKCLEMRTPVIIATQLLESMIESPVPTRAEVVDVTVAAEMGVDALMLTGETSVGKYPIEAVQWLKRIVDHAEANVGRFVDKVIAKARGKLEDIRDKFAKGVLELAEDLGAKLLIFSMYGNTARRIAVLKPKVQVYVGSSDIRVLRKLSILWGLRLMHVEAKVYEEGLQKALEKAIELNYVSYGELAVLTYGLRESKQHIEILRVEL